MIRPEYDPAADALYIYVEGYPNEEPVIDLIETLGSAAVDAPPRVRRSVVLDDHRTVDFDEQGRVVGIEILGASQGVHVTDLIDRFALYDIKAELTDLEHTVYDRSAAAG